MSVPPNPRLFRMQRGAGGLWAETDVSLRDLFAGLAMLGSFIESAGPTGSGVLRPETIAEAAYEQADAMLEERAKRRRTPEETR